MEQTWFHRSDGMLITTASAIPGKPIPCHPVGFTKRIHRISRCLTIVEEKIPVSYAAPSDTSYSGDEPMTKIRNQLPELTRIAVLGGTKLGAEATTMAKHIGHAIVDARCCLVTGGRKGAGQAASEGAADACQKYGLDTAHHIIALVPEGKSSDYDIGGVIQIRADKVARRVVLVSATVGAIVVGGGKGTKSEVLISAMEAAMDGYRLIPVSGTGGEADRMCAHIAPFADPILNRPAPSSEKARAIVAAIQQVPCWYCGIDSARAHYDWFEDPEKEALVKEMRRIRHKYF